MNNTAIGDYIHNISTIQPALLDRMVSDKKFATKIMNSFLEDVHQRAMDIKQALGKRDALTVSVQAKTIKGSSNSVGATTLEEVAHQIEIAGESGDLAKAGSLFPKISEYIEIIKTHWHNQDFKKLVSFYDNLDCRR